MPPGVKSEYLFFGMRNAASVAGYHISVTSVRGFFVTLSIRVLSMKTVVATPTGNGPGNIGSSGLSLRVLLDAPNGASIATIISTCVIEVAIPLRIAFSFLGFLVSNFWFLVSGLDQPLLIFWKPETSNQKLETRNLETSLSFDCHRDRVSAAQTQSC